MSKRLKNYPDPVAVVNKFGADALRLVAIVGFLSLCSFNPVFLRLQTGMSGLTGNVSR